MRIRHLVLVLAVAGLTLAACDKKDSTSETSGGEGGGANGYAGSVASSGLYSATWSPSPEAKADPLNSLSHLTLVSDKQTYGNILVGKDGVVDFGSAAPEFGHNIAFKGTGAKVTLDKSGAYVCAVTLDNDLKSTDDPSIVLHLKGSLTVHWHPEGLGGINCP